MPFSIRRSAVDANYLEVISDGSVVREIASSFPFRNAPSSFSSIEEIEAWLLKAERKLAKEAAYRHLGRRSFSKVALLKKLREKLFSLSICEEVISELEKLGYLSDDDFFKRAIERELARGYGARYIRIKLRAQGFDCRIEIDDAAALRKILPKFRSKERPKMIQALLRRGFDLDRILKELD